MASYRYDPIPDPAKTARVLSLAPGQLMDTLSGTLSPMSVESPQPFEALSYAWGRDTNQEIIYCDGQTLQIRTSLAVALKRLRHTTRPRVLWVDQICVNQKDLIERSQQVRHMNLIYQKASKVLVWLGVDGGGYADRAFMLLESLAEVSQDPLRFEQFKQQQFEGKLDLYPKDHWNALSQLFKLPWFDRKWILQEIGTDAPSEMFWGHFCIGWDVVCKAAALLKDHGFFLCRQYDLLVWKPRYMNQLFSSSMYKSKALNFIYELHRARWQLTNDPRDHIFALLGHPAAFETPGGQRLIEADYQKSTETIYHDLAIRMLQKGDSLMILNAVQHETLEKSAQRRVLPSWVPQWDLQDSLHNLLGDDTCVYRPSRDIRPEPKLLQNDMTLQLRGLKIDVVSTLTDTFSTFDIALGSPAVARAWQAQPECESDGFTTARKYCTGEPALFAFLETLSAVKQRKGQAPIPETQRLADGADFLVQSFGASHTIGDDVRSMSQCGQRQKWMERVSGGANCRRFARGRLGYYALCPPAAREGDELGLLLGGQTLFCLRPSGNGHLFVGECYVHGVMDGEALDWVEQGERVLQEFMIR